MKYSFDKLKLNEMDNFLAAPYSEEHGDGCLLHDDPVQMGAGLLIENIGEDNGMIVIVRGDELAFVIKDMGNEKVAFIDFSKRDFHESGRIFRELELDYFGILIDCGEDINGKRKYRIMSNFKVWM